MEFHGVVKIGVPLTVPQVAELTGAGETQIKNAIRDGRLRASQVGAQGIYLIDPAELRGFRPRPPGRPDGSLARRPRTRRTRTELSG